MKLHKKINDKKSPLTAPPLRYVGQSLDEKINRLINEDAVPYILVCFVLTIMAAFDWLRYFGIVETSSPIIMTSMAVGFIFYSVYKISKILKEVKLIRLGRDGERAVGQYLDSFRENGHKIFHDILGDNFNLDHVIISRKGFFVVETKTYSKPIKGSPTISFDGEKLFIKEYGTLTKPVIQVKASSNWLEHILLQTTGKKFSIKPVILFPGWFVESTEKGRKSSIWVLNPKALPRFIENQPDVIPYEDVKLAAYHLSRYIRMKKIESKGPSGF